MTPADREVINPAAVNPARLEAMKDAIAAMVAEYEESGQSVTLTLVGYSNSGNPDNYGPIGAGTFNIPADLDDLRNAIANMEDGFSLGGPQGGTPYNQGNTQILKSGVNTA